MDDNEVEDGAPCTQIGCEGTFAPSKVMNCSCHISPPCSACADAGYTCDACGYETAPYEAPEPYDPPRRKTEDRSNDWTHTHTANPYNSTPFTACCGVAAINTDRCPSCRARIIYHNDGLAERRRWAKGGCLMCGKPRHKAAFGEPGTCCC